MKRKSNLHAVLFAFRRTRVVRQKKQDTPEAVNLGMITITD